LDWNPSQYGPSALKPERGPFIDAWTKRRNREPHAACGSGATVGGPRKTDLCMERKECTEGGAAVPDTGFRDIRARARADCSGKSVREGSTRGSSIAATVPISRKDKDRRGAWGNPTRATTWRLSGGLARCEGCQERGEGNLVPRRGGLATDSFPTKHTEIETADTGSGNGAACFGTGVGAPSEGAAAAAAALAVAATQEAPPHGRVGGPRASEAAVASHPGTARGRGRGPHGGGREVPGGGRSGAQRAVIGRPGELDSKACAWASHGPQGVSPHPGASRGGGG